MSLVPTFFVCGAPRAGTTSLHRYLSQHPDVCMSRRKETGVFLENYDRGLDWLAENYLAHYQGEHAIGESTTGHMRFSKAPRRMATHLPEARTVFVLRDPADRIYSHYIFHRKSGVLKADDCFSSLIRDEDSEWREIHIDNGRYAKHLKRYAQHFPRHQMLVLLFKQLKTHPVALVQRVYRFLGVEDAFVPDMQRQHNAGRLPRNERLYLMAQKMWKQVKKRVGVGVLHKTQAVRDWASRLLTQKENIPPMSEADRAYLRSVYRTSNQELERWLDRDLSHWT